MGLDMYLYAKRYLFTDNDRKAVPKIAKALQIPAGFELKEFKIEAGYWRKANQVHRWFVEHVQDGTDDCGYYYVQKHDLMELRKLCQEILDDRSKVTMLPTTSGFFFGNESYDE